MEFDFLTQGGVASLLALGLLLAGRWPGKQQLRSSLKNVFIGRSRSAVRFRKTLRTGYIELVLHMFDFGGPVMRRHWRRWLLGIAFVYVLLWVATAIWGPTAMIAHQRETENARDQFGKPYPEDERQRLSDFIVPAPFVVKANWEHGGEPVGRIGFARGDLWGLWFPGMFWMIEDRMTVVGCD